ASAVKIIKPFSGENQEDVNSWLRDFNLLTSACGLSEEETIRALICSLRGVALSWVSNLYEVTPNISVTEIKTSLALRFTSRMRCDLILKELYESCPNNLENYFKLLEKSSYLFNKHYLPAEALTDIVISKSPN
ncbi:hypothetical protein H311_05135, partial [Anncaliia algerae PRA109]